MTFGRDLSPLAPNRPRTVDEHCAVNDVVLFDRDVDPAEMTNLAASPAHREVVGEYCTKLGVRVGHVQ